ncbi:MAG: hypothetical protein ACO3NL_08895, partial [Phycisphaerales bacterium]
MPNPMDQCTSSSEESPAVAEAKRMFRSTLATWAQDLLIARQQGLLSMSWRTDSRPADTEQYW